MTPRMRSFFSRSNALLLSLLVVLGTTALAQRSNAASMHRRGQRYEDVYYLPPDAWLRPMSLDYQEALADLLWMRSLLYFGEELGHRGQTRYVFAYIDAILTLDPGFRAAYKWAAVAGLYHSGTVTTQDGYRVIDYLERAVQRWPDDGEFYWELGAALRFELAPLVDDPVEKRRLYEAAMEPLATAARLGAGPPWLSGLNAQLMRKLGKTEQAIRHIEEMYELVQNPVEKEQLRFELIRLRSESYATAFDAANKDVLASRNANYPYMTSNLFLVLGPRIDRARHALLQRRFLPDDPIIAGAADPDETSPEEATP